MCVRHVAVVERTSEKLSWTDTRRKSMVRLQVDCSVRSNYVHVVYQARASIGCHILPSILDLASTRCRRSKQNLWLESTIQGKVVEAHENAEASQADVAFDDRGAMTEMIHAESSLDVNIDSTCFNM